MYTKRSETPLKFFWLYARAILPIQLLINLFIAFFGYWADSFFYFGNAFFILYAITSLPRFTYYSFRFNLLHIFIDVGLVILDCILYFSEYGFIYLSKLLYLLAMLAYTSAIVFYFSKRFALFASKPLTPIPLRIMRAISPASLVSSSLRDGGIPKSADIRDLQDPSFKGNIDPIPVLTGDSEVDSEAIRQRIVDVRAKVDAAQNSLDTLPYNEINKPIATILYKEIVYGKSHLEELQNQLETTAGVPGTPPPIPKLTRRMLNQAQILQRRIHLNREHYLVLTMADGIYDKDSKKGQDLKAALDQAYRTFKVMEHILFLIYRY